MISVILSGGSGTRLWPVSREMHPKPFLRLSDGRSLLQKAFLRAARLSGPGNILTITRQELYFQVEDEIAALGLELATGFILEPFGRNTAPAIAAAALEVERTQGAQTLMLILPADHLISNQLAFSDAVKQAQQLAAENKIVLFGIEPKTPETGYGYIEARGDKVLRFVEKPNQAVAAEYVKNGNFYWNSGIFCFKAGTVLQELARHAPEVLAAVESCLAASKPRNDNVLRLAAATFELVPNISIDYAVMESSSNLALVRCDIGWSDLGSWDCLCALESADHDGNRVRHPSLALLRETKNCDIQNSNRLIATLGVEGLLIVDTPDALLIADKRRSRDVNIIYNDLKTEEHDTYRHHHIIYRPWGSFVVLEAGDNYKIKHLEIKPGSSISLQLHHHRNEHWIVVRGRAEVTCDDKIYFVDTNESTYIKAGSRHRIHNPGQVPLVVIEVQSGLYLSEDDIVRIDDIYGRGGGSS
jgi:mannose-1-phosphate guanylyltransferase/mannose-6-phosphate isomerase